MTIGALGCVAAQGEAASPGCMPDAAVRLVCDRDGCVRPASDTDCRATPVALTRTVRQPRRVATAARTGRDELSILLARLD